MRCLPFLLTRGALLGEMIREAARDPRRNSLCSSCGAQMPIMPDRVEQKVRCPACARWQHVTMGEELPWRLSASAAEALRRTGRWVRRL